MRKIIHIDMDAFFASIEQRDHPELKGKPVAVGGSGKRGVVAAASYQARKFGVFSAQPSSIAMRKCPQLIFVKPRFDIYKLVSAQIRDIFMEYSDLVEPLSLDEAYLDVTENKKGMATATEIALEIKARIKTKTQLTASAGVSINKFLAKVASDQNKPDGIFVIKPKAAEPFVDKLPIEKFHGIGKVTATKMHKMGINTGADLKLASKEALVRRFGKTGSYYYDIARAIDHRPVNPNRVRKSLGAERTFEDDLTEDEEIITQIKRIAAILFDRIDRAKTSGKTITLKLKFNDFEIINRSKTTGHLMACEEEILPIAMELLKRELPVKKGIRLIGLAISNLDHQMDEVGTQLTLGF